MSETVKKRKRDEKSKKNKILVGLDISLRSPGFCVIHNDQINLYYWAQLKRYKTPATINLLAADNNESEESSKKESEESKKVEKRNIRITRFDALPRDKYVCIERIVSNILDVLLKYNDKKMKIFLEDYAYGQQSSSMTILAELCGHLKISLLKNGYKWIEKTPPTVKKSFTNNGHSSKEDMVAEWVLRTNNSLCDVLQCREHQSPYHDLVDAYALANFQNPKEQKQKKNTKKRKKKMM